MVYDDSSWRQVIFYSGYVLIKVQCSLLFALEVVFKNKPRKVVKTDLDFISVYGELWKTGMFERMSLQTDEDEHSIEMHLPYTAKAMERY